MSPRPPTVIWRNFERYLDGNENARDRCGGEGATYSNGNAHEGPWRAQATLLGTTQAHAHVKAKPPNCWGCSLGKRGIHIWYVLTQRVGAPRRDADDRQAQTTRAVYLCPCARDVVDYVRVGVVGDSAGTACRVQDPEDRRPRRRGLGQRHPLGVGNENRFLFSSRGRARVEMGKYNAAASGKK